MSVTFADLQLLAIDSSTLPPMSGRNGKARRTDSKRGNAAKRETVARRQARMFKAGV